MFADRNEAGNMLALRLVLAKTQCDFVFGITRGGIMIGEAISKALEKPLLPLVVKKVSYPGSAELALGAITYDKVYTIDENLIKRSGLKEEAINKLFESKYSEVLALKKKFGFTKLPTLTNKNIIVADDGVATGSTVKAAGLYLLKKHARLLILAVPVISKETYSQLTTLYNKIEVLEVADKFFAVGEFYRSFPQVEENEIIKILKI